MPLHGTPFAQGDRVGKSELRSPRVTKAISSDLRQHCLKHSQGKAPCTFVLPEGKVAYQCAALADAAKGKAHLFGVDGVLVLAAFVQCEKLSVI